MFDFIFETVPDFMFDTLPTFVFEEIPDLMADGFSKTKSKDKKELEKLRRLLDD